MEEIHFEQIWNEAERIGSLIPEESSTSAIISNIIVECSKFEPNEGSPEEQAKVIGEILYYLCQLTREKNINSAAALVHATSKRQIIE